LTLVLYQQADASKRRPVRVFTRYFAGIPHPGQVSNSPLRFVSTKLGANPLGRFLTL
jgi:hypothetical protein